MSCRISNLPPATSGSGHTFPAPGSPNALTRSVVPATFRDRPVYAYIVTTIKTAATPPNFQLIQGGSAPNFDGGRITLCTCKHKDRATFYPSGNPAKPWDEVWVAGLTSKSAYPSRSLAYLMLVKRVFRNQHALWKHLPLACRRAKSASRSPIGDLYEPRPSASANPHDPANYQPPVVGHVHTHPSNPTYWHHDVEEWSSPRQPAGRRHHLLLGDSQWSYRWRNATMRLQPNAMGNTAHHKVFPSLNDFIANLI